VTTEEINIQKMTPFFTLIKTKDTTLPEYKYCLDKFLDTKADIDSPDQFGISAFWYCYQNQKIDLAFYLASKGADINRLDNYGFFALKKEVFENNLDRIKRLIDSGADINMKDEFQRTVLHHSFNRYKVGNDLSIIRYLIGKGADINAKDFKNRTPLHYLFVKSNRRFRNEQNDPADVMVECINQYPEIVLNEGDNNGNTILHYICQCQAIECLNLLSQRITKKDLEVLNDDKNTPLAVGMINLHMKIA
jgi:ankyrin repeat protein